MSVNWHPETAETALGMYLDVLFKMRCLRRNIGVSYIRAAHGSGRLARILSGGGVKSGGA